MYYPSSENKDADQLRSTAKLICVFVFAYADCWFSHEAAQLFRTVSVTCHHYENMPIQYTDIFTAVKTEYFI